MRVVFLFFSFFLFVERSRPSSYTELPIRTSVVTNSAQINGTVGEYYYYYYYYVME